MTATYLSLDQFMAYIKKEKCSHCDKKPMGFSGPDSPAYCDDHFPYHEEKNEKKSCL